MTTPDRTFLTMLQDLSKENPIAHVTADLRQQLAEKDAEIARSANKNAESRARASKEIRRLNAALTAAEERAAETLALLNAEIAKHQWQPIEEAPVGETPIIATDGRLVFRTCQQKLYDKWPHQEGGPTYYRLWAYEDFNSNIPWSPTHYMPFPEAPRTEDDE